MLRTNWICLLALLIGGSLLYAQDEEKIQSGPKTGAFIPKPFECFNINGPAKGRPHCLVCRFALSPAVLIFAKEPVEGKDEAFTDLLDKLEKTATDFEDRNFSVGVVILSKSAFDSTNNANKEKAEEIIEEAVNREKLVEQLTKRSEKFKHVIVGYYPLEGPKGYELNPKAEMTILFYERMKIIENYAFAPGALQDKDVERIVKGVREALPLRKKPAETK